MYNSDTNISNNKSEYCRNGLLSFQKLESVIKDMCNNAVDLNETLSDNQNERSSCQSETFQFYLCIRRTAS